jgi:sarcosine oxidase subunit gamma
MLEINLTVNESKSFNNLLIKEKTPILKLNLRGKIDNKDFNSSIEKTLGIILPAEVGSIVLKGDLSVITTGPNEWLIISNNIENNDNQLENILFEAVPQNNLGAVTNITDQFTIFSLVGSNALEVLSKSSPFNFDMLSNNFSAQTLLNNIDITVIKKDDENIDLLVRRSFSSHLWAWLNDSARFL